MKNFKNINSIEELKNQYRALIKANHPDNGGKVEKMQEINAEFDALYAIWKDRTEQAGGKVEETAAQTRRRFYTQNGWEGSRYDGRLTLKEIAAIVRAYVKEKYPTCKFSVRTKYASMCQELLIDIKEFPAQMYKTGAELMESGPIDYNSDEIGTALRKLYANKYFTADSWTDEEFCQAYDAAIAESKFCAIKSDYFAAVLDDVDAFVNSYNYDDCDGMTDYFDVNFYFFGVHFNECKQVEKTARVADKMPKTPAPQDQPAKEEPAQIEEAYTITADTDTRDNSPLWVVKLKKYVDRATFDTIRAEFKKIGGYYSRFKGGFIFREDPTGKINIAA